MATISTHNRSSVSRGHNLRKEEIVSKESHIDPEGIHETWFDEAPRRAYERIFGQAVKEYNEKQNREDRRIKDYYNHVRDDAKKNCCYEMIVGVYPAEGETVTEEQGKDIMREFVDGWKERNPNLEVIGVYYHADEQGKAPHVHIDYIPVAHGYKNGPETQNAIVKALREQGFKKQGKATAQILWEKRENEVLESLCNSRGISVEHPQEGKGVKHLHTQAYKVQKDLEAAEKELTSLQEQIEQQEQAKEVNEKFLHRQKMQIDMYRKQIGRYDEQISGMEGKIDSLAKERDNLAEENEKVLKWQQDANAELLKLKDEKTRLEKNVVEQRAELEDMTARVERARAALREVSVEVRDKVRQIYREVVEGILETKNAVKRHDLPGAERVISETESKMHKQAENVEGHSHIPASVVAAPAQKVIEDAKELVKKEYPGGAGSAGVQNAQKDSVREKLEKFSQESQKGRTEPSQASERQDIKRRHRGR